MNPEDVAIYYYYVDKSGDEHGWYPGSTIKGWLPETELLEVEVNGTRYLGFLVRHGALVQVGSAPGKAAVQGASAVPLGGERSGDFAVFLVLVVVLLAGAARATRHAPSRD